MRLNVGVDSSAFISITSIGRLDLISTAFDEMLTTVAVKEEVLTERNRGTSALTSLLDDVSICETTSEAQKIASLKRIAIRTKCRDEDVRHEVYGQHSVKYR